MVTLFLFVFTDHSTWRHYGGNPKIPKQMQLISLCTVGNSQNPQILLERKLPQTVSRLEMFLIFKNLYLSLQMRKMVLSVADTRWEFGKALICLAYHISFLLLLLPTFYERHCFVHWFNSVQPHFPVPPFTSLTGWFQWALSWQCYRSLIKVSDWHLSPKGINLFLAVFSWLLSVFLWSDLSFSAQLHRETQWMAELSSVMHSLYSDSCTGMVVTERLGHL